MAKQSAKHPPEQSSYGTMDDGRSAESFTQVRVPRGAMGAPRTVLDGGLLLRSLDHNNDGQLDQLEASQIATGAEIISQGQMETSLAPPGAATIPTSMRSCGSVMHSQLLFRSSPSLSPESGRLGSQSVSPARHRDDGQLQQPLKER